ncbi:MAG: hypothetical protein KC457_19585 [Myxococcales bacterium]|nr:hypothetical protein [Myxococcales bacterium]
MEELRSLAHGQFDDVYLVVHYTSVASAEDWKRFITSANEAPKLGGLLVVAGGAKLEADQRNDIRDLYEKHKMKIGVLSDSRITRGITTALSWFGIQVRAFRSSELAGLAEYLGQEARLEELRSTVIPLLGRSYDESKADMKLPNS